VHANHIESIRSKFPNALLYSQVSKEPVSTALPKLQSAQVLIVDTVGLLSTIYRYADVAFVGGGFGAGIHNILEATAFGVPTVFGTNHYKFPEAKELIDIGAAFSISNENDLNIVLDSLLFNDEKMKSIFTLNKNFVQNRAGATGKIMKAISE
jgi:3-deoxy-D-manno-octulosonic-acid transferase